MRMFGRGWAQPVVSKRWALVATVTDRVKRMSGFRLCVGSSHRAWERACGIPRVSV